MASSNQFYDLKNKRIVLGLSLCGLPTHAQGSLKPIQFLQSRNNEIIYRFNRKLSEFLEPIGVPVFDTFNLTLGVHSYVGTHYGAGVNMIKAQLFLKLLDQRFS